QHVIPSVVVIDGSGGSQTLTVTLTDNKAVTPGSWLVSVTDKNGAQIADGEIRFSTDGSLQVGFNTFTFDFAPAGAQTSTITFDFGTPGSTTSGTTNFSGGTDSTLTAGTPDGFAAGSITKTTIDADGNLVL